MTKRKLPRPTEGELEILRIIWQQGPSTVRQVNHRLAEVREVGYTTTLKLMQIMSEKGLLTRDTRVKTHIYEAAVSQETTQAQLVSGLLDSAFGGSAMKLVMQALGNKKSSAAEIKEIRDYLDQLEKGKK